MLRRTRIKICGITTVADAMAAVDAGADAIGLVFYPKSSRNIDIEQASQIAAALPPFVSSVGLFVDPALTQVQQVMAKVRLSMLQFHGSESSDFARQFSLPYLKAIRLGEDPAASISSVVNEHVHAQGFLVEPYDASKAGGAGKVFDWQLFPKDLHGAVLAGGLDPDNVGAAIAQTGACAVDVSSGVESSPGEKCAERIHEFIQACRHADRHAIENTVI